MFLYIYIVFFFHLFMFYLDHFVFHGLSRLHNFIAPFCVLECDTVSVTVWQQNQSVILSMSAADKIMSGLVLSYKP